jgi:hypothetical protein
MGDHTAQSLSELASLGMEMRRIMESEAYQAGIGLAQARIFEKWTQSDSALEQESLHAEWRALERLQEAFRTIDSDGAVAQEAIKRTQGLPE